MESIVQTVEGLVKGKLLQSKSHLGGKYWSFQGIPYAQPPVGPLRFTPPKRVEPWSGVYDAFALGPVCPALSFITREYDEDSDEDCLRLNVYTNQLNDGGSKTLKRAVMVWIHGGGFCGGSSNTDFYGPDHLVSKDIVLVSINYRLGPLGFLSLQNAACPGNNGLRDMVEALHWVQRNIPAFGGDTSNVTIFGESAGGAAVQYLMLTPLSKGLFHRAISQSGSVLASWGRTHDPVAHAFKLGEVLGLKTNDKDKLLEFLRLVPARTLVAISMKLLKKLQPDWHYVGNPFNPTTEPASPDAFLCEPVEDLIRQGALHDVPYIVGVNTLEGLIMAQKGMPPLNTKEELERLLPVHPHLKRGTPLADTILQKLKDYYFPNGYDEHKCADLLSAQYFIVPSDTVLLGLGNNKTRKSQTYSYLFTYDGGLSLFKEALGYSHWQGTFHGDEIPCLLYSHLKDYTAEPGSPDAKAIDTMLKLWVDFAITGNPTPDTKLWEPYNNVEKPYLDIGLELTPKKDLYEYADEFKFWTAINADIDAAAISHKL